MNSISATVTSTVISRPSANSYTRRPLGASPMASRCGRGTSESVAPVSTRNNPSHARSGSAGFRMVTVTCVAPIASLPSSACAAIMEYVFHGTTRGREPARHAPVLLGRPHADPERGVFRRCDGDVSGLPASSPALAGSPPGRRAGRPWMPPVGAVSYGGSAEDRGPAGPPASRRTGAPRRRAGRVPGRESSPHADLTAGRPALAGFPPHRGPRRRAGRVPGRESSPHTDGGLTDACRPRPKRSSRRRRPRPRRGRRHRPRRAGAGCRLAGLSRRRGPAALLPARPDPPRQRARPGGRLDLRLRGVARRRLDPVHEPARGRRRAVRPVAAARRVRPRRGHRGRAVAPRPGVAGGGAARADVVGRGRRPPPVLHRRPHPHRARPRDGRTRRGVRGRRPARPHAARRVGSADGDRARRGVRGPARVRFLHLGKRRGPARQHPRLRRRRRRPGVAVRHHPAARRPGGRDVGARGAGERGRRERLDRDDPRRRPRPALRPHRVGHARLLRRPAPRRQPVRQLPARPRRPHRRAALALPGGAARHLGTATCPRRRPWCRSNAAAPSSTRWR